MRQFWLGLLTIVGPFALQPLIVENTQMSGEVYAIVIVLTTVAGLGLIATSIPIRPYMPSVRLELQHPGFAIRYEPAEKRRTRRLKKETMRVVTDIYEHLKHKQVPLEEAIRSVASDKERDWDEQRAKLDHERTAEQLELRQLFGGRVMALVKEYERRGMLDPTERHHIDWSLGSSHWIQSTAQQLDALAREL